MRYYFLYVPQILLLALYDWIFFANEYAQYPANCWWAFALLHATVVIEIVASCFLRRMKAMPLIKKHPMWLFSCMMVLQLILATIFSLIRAIPLKWVIILQFAVIGVELLSLGILYLVQRYRDKRDPALQAEEEEETEDTDETTDEDTEDVEEEVCPPPQKMKSSAMLLLMGFLSDPGAWNVPSGFEEIYALTELASESTQYTYEDLSALESDLKTQTNALKTYLHNESWSRAKACISKITDILQKREEEISAIENDE